MNAAEYDRIRQTHIGSYVSGERYISKERFCEGCGKPFEPYVIAGSTMYGCPTLEKAERERHAAGEGPLAVPNPGTRIT